MFGEPLLACIRDLYEVIFISMLLITKLYLYDTVFENISKFRLSSAHLLQCDASTGLKRGKLL